ncbi:family 16 glycoside hydrolase [Bradyrhizobium sp. WYCCWR 12699]|uniref:family 16 glycoside hydrolase n=1 Tax=Bradyrhizobium sp. WYCCWR 12699 TaxID=3064203 RepID=UPI0028A3ABF7|nr:family 16 glycoside hydrolase [Bradyrhizobium sp. WYCCWR 12699]MDT4737246.1 family 16 glycoside hydrolase [Bradyrhizobium sp. WYCCWR 12699]
MNIGSASQPTDFALDVLGRYVCNTFDEALANSDPAYRANARDIKGNPLPARGDMRPFDFVVIGGGTFGSAVAEHLRFRSSGRSERILVLEAGPILLAEHMQNLPSINLGREVWGLSWNAAPVLGYAASGLAYCVGGRSIWWGGWSPRLLDTETRTDWPQAVLDDLNAKKLPNGDNGYFRQSGQQIGVTATNDYIFGELHHGMREQLYSAIIANRISGAVDLAALPEAPPVEILDTPPTLDDLASLLGLTPPNPPSDPAQSQQIEAEMRNKLKLEAPLAVQARPEHSGFFPLNKFSAVPLLIKAARGAFSEAPGDDVRKRLMIVPRCHVSRLSVTNDPDGLRVDGVITERGRIPLSPDAKVIVALGTIESTRLALSSFGADGRIGTNLMAHLRSNVTLRVPREAFSAISPSVKTLQTSALLLKGRHQFLGADNNPDGTFGHFHFQITASGLGNAGSNSEAELFQKVPDIDTLQQHLNASDSHVIVTIRGIGEMQPDNAASNVTLDLDPGQVDYGERKAFVNLQPNPKDEQLWEAMDKASDELAVAFANGHKVDFLHPVTGAGVQLGADATSAAAVIPHMRRDQHPNGRRDPLGSTHHEAGTLRMGDDPTASVTNANCRFHGIKNAYVVGPALFPTIGSPNPMLTGIALARRLGDHLLPPPPAAAAETGFRYLFDGTEKSTDLFAKWNRVGGGNFAFVRRTLIAQPDSNGIGLLYYAAEQFDDFTLRLDFCLPHPRGSSNDNSGVFLRFRNPKLPESPGTPGPDVPGNLATVAVDTGYEVQIDEEARGDTRKGELDGFLFNRTGAIYKVKTIGTSPGQQNYTNGQRLAAGTWHSFDITVTDRTYEVMLNGQPSTKFTADPTDPNERFRGRMRSEDPDSGFIGLQVHTGTVAFANVRIRSNVPLTA